MRHYRQPLLVINGIEPETSTFSTDPQNLNFEVTTSYHLQAIKEGAGRTVTPISMEGLIITRDNRRVWGVRGGQIKNGVAHLSPAGNLTYAPNDTSPIFRFFSTELEKELGVSEDPENSALIGHQDSPVIKGIGFAIVGEINETFKEVEELHREAFCVYKDAKDRGLPELDARDQIGIRNLPNVDAWEHVKLFPIENDHVIIQKIINERSVIVDGCKFPLVDVGRGSLFLYDKYAF
jgi:hypothetical protein